MEINLIGGSSPISLYLHVRLGLFPKSGKRNSVRDCLQISHIILSEFKRINLMILS